MKTELKKELWEGHDKIVFEINGRESYIVCPSVPARDKPWVWRSEYFGAFDTVDRALLAKGWHIAYHRASQMYGSPDAVSSMKDFHDFICAEFGLSQKAVNLGFSVGGLYSFNYGVTHPEDTRSLYLDAPVTNILTHKRMPESWPKLCAAYHADPDKLLGMGLSPNDRAAEFARYKIPVILVAGLKDTAAVYEINGAVFAELFTAAGGEIHTILKPDCGHHPHSLEDPTPIVDWILAH